MKYIPLIVHIYFRWTDNSNHHNHLGIHADGAAIIVNLKGLAPTTKYSSLKMARVMSTHNSG